MYTNQIANEYNSYVDKLNSSKHFSSVQQNLHKKADLDVDSCIPQPKHPVTSPSADSLPLKVRSHTSYLKPSWNFAKLIK